MSLFPVRRASLALSFQELRAYVYFLAVTGQALPTATADDPGCAEAVVFTPAHLMVLVHARVKA